MADLLSLSPDARALLTLCVVAVMFLLFLRETYPPEVTAFAGAASLLAMGVLPYEAAVKRAGQPCPLDDRGDVSL